MDIDLPPGVIAEYEIAIPGIVSGYRLVASCRYYLAELAHILMSQSDIQIAMFPGLLTKQSVDAPAVIDPNLDAVAFKKLQ